jgi:small subunit ribosomal protein S6
MKIMAEKKTKKTAAATKRVSTPKPDSNQYEAMFLFPPPGVVDVDGMVKNAQGIIERHGGKILVIKKWDERKLAYEVKKQKRGTYIVAFYQGPGASVGAIERDVNLSEDILRVLVTDANHLNEKEMSAVEPQPIQPREERAPWDKPDFNRPPRRDDRGDRGDRGERGDRGDRAPRREEVPAEASADAE